MFSYNIFLSPHNDDETLWGAFSIMRENLLPVIVFDGHLQQNRGVRVTAMQRRMESFNAMRELDAAAPVFLGLHDDTNYTTLDITRALDRVVGKDIGTLYAPIYHVDGHSQHNIVSLAADNTNAGHIVRYSTYIRSEGRQRTDNEVLPLDGSMIRRKHLALACYASQCDIDERLGCWPWFVGDLREYVL